MAIEKKNFEDCVNMSIDSGVIPLELKFYPIVDVEENTPIAYRTKLVVHSILLGDMKENSYIEVSDAHRCSIDLLERSVIHVFQAYKRFVKEEKEIDFISMRCPSELIERVSLFDFIKDLLDKNPWFDPTKLCLEFPTKIFKQDFEKSKRALLDMKLLHIKTAIIGCGNDDFMLSKLVDITPDYVFLDPNTTSYAGSRNKPQLVPTMILYIKSMGIKTICEGIEPFRKALRNTDAYGFFDIKSDELSLREAVKHEDVVEELYG